MSDLAELASAFARSLTKTVQAVAPTAQPFRALIGTSPDRVSVGQGTDTGIVLTVQSEPLLSLKVGYKCTWDGAGTFLAVESSEFQVFAGEQAGGEPLFRYDYVRSAGKDMPGAHLQVHAHRDAITYVMSRVGDSTRRARRRRDSPQVPRMSELHFPMGGSRFRPCLEDLLEMLVCELGVDCDQAGRRALVQGRVDWRRQQTRTVVRDSPEDAIAVLTGMGYTVTPTDQVEPTTLSARLSQL